MNDPKLWGKSAWQILEYIADLYDRKKHQICISFDKFILCFIDLLLCNTCRRSSKYFVTKLFPPPVSSSYLEWSTYIHNFVNSKLKQPLFPIDISRVREQNIFIQDPIKFFSKEHNIFITSVLNYYDLTHGHHVKREKVLKSLEIIINILNSDEILANRILVIKQQDNPIQKKIQDLFES